MVPLLLVVGVAAHAAEREENTPWRVTEIYLATLGYAPNAEGVAYWVQNIDTDPLWTPTTVAQSFFDQPLIQEAYPESLGHGPLIESLYQNLFDRSADAEGLAYWIEALESGRIDRNEMIIAMIEGGWGNPDAEQDMVRFGNRVRVAQAFMEQQVVEGLNYDELSADKQERFRVAGREVIAAVTADAGTVETAIAQIPALLARLDSQVGFFIDTQVSGLEYSTPTVQGVTSEDGRFFYQEGEDVEFRLGSITLGSARGERVITPMSLVDGSSPDDPRVQDRVRLLMMLDSDGDLSNGIQISPWVIHLAQGWGGLAFGTEDFEGQAERIRQELEATDDYEQVSLPGREQAAHHLSTSFFCAYTGAYQGRYTGDYRGRAAVLLFDGKVLGAAENTDTGARQVVSGSVVPGPDAFASFGVASLGGYFQGIVSPDGWFSGTWVEGWYEGTYDLAKESMGDVNGPGSTSYLLAYDTLSQGSSAGEDADIGLLRVIVTPAGEVAGEGFSVNRWLMNPGSEIFAVSGDFSSGQFSLETEVGSIQAQIQGDGQITGSYTGQFGQSSVSGCRELVP
nr:DUF4214 domain-containing protein [Ectothiorhodospira variabilis]